MIVKVLVWGINSGHSGISKRVILPEENLEANFELEPGDMA
jgi:hypothetical protein